MMKSLFIFLILSLTLISNSQAKILVKNHCFENHIRESIEINKMMKTYYSSQTNGESDRIFNFLIQSEKLALIGAKYFDREAVKFHKQGQDVFCQEFLPMILQTKKTVSQNFAFPQKFDWKKYSRLLRREIRLKDFDAIKDYSLEALKELAPQPQYHCFTRHLIESIYRFAYFVQLRENKLEKNSQDSPRNLLARAMEYQLIGLWGAHRIDKMSLPLQMKGIPLLCDQLPSLLDGLL
jgi:hypothetical protein